MANELACPQAPGSETTGHRWGFDKSRSLWTSRRLVVVFGEEAAAGIPASPIPQQAYPIVMCRIVGSQHREQARRCTISSLLPRCSRSADLDPLIVKEGMRTHQPSVSRSRRDTPSVGATSSSARVSAEVQRQSGPEANTQRRLLPEPITQTCVPGTSTCRLVAPLGASLAIAIRWEMPQGCEGP